MVPRLRRDQLASRVQSLNRSPETRTAAIALTSSEVDTLGEGAAVVSATQTDAAGNAQTAAAATTTFTIDTVAPGTPTFALNADTGSSDTDNVTNDATVNVTPSQRQSAGVTA